jgi:CRISPR/Cas system-associated exonuclease Cas4 (RecB family)
MRTIRASEIGTYLYCQRAWWYQRQGMKSENLAELAGGTELHEQHGRAVMTAGCLRVLAYALLLASLVLVTIAITHSLL